jgi:hypothetical protein
MIVVELSGQDLIYLRRMLNGEAITSARFAIDGGLKVSVNQQVWTLPMGVMQQ